MREQSVRQHKIVSALFFRAVVARTGDVKDVLGDKTVSAAENVRNAKVWSNL